MYTDRDKEDILQDMLEVTRDDVDKREGAIVFDALAPPAEEHELLGFVMEAISENAFIDTAQAEYIDKRANELGVYRKPAEQGKGTLIFTGRKDTVVDIGTLVVAESDEGLVALQTVEYAVIPESGETTLEAVAMDAGANGNIRANSELTCETLPDVIVTNPEPFSEGVDEESGDELKQRYLLKVRKPITSGNIYHYELWAREVPGISQARVIPLWNGPGTVKVILINSEGRAPTPEQVTAVFEHIEEQRPIGAIVTAVPINEVPVNISATLELVGDLSPTDVKKAVEESVSNYLTTAGTKIRHSHIASAIVETEGVKDYNNLLIGIGVEMGAANILVSPDDVAVVGEVTLT